jgi:hypothetical protein
MLEETKFGKEIPVEKVREPQEVEEEGSVQELGRWQALIQPLPANIRPTRRFLRDLRLKLFDSRLRLVALETDEPPLAA